MNTEYGYRITMISVCILIPSHVRSLDHLKLIYGCLKSVTHQTYVATVFMSVSFRDASLRSAFSEQILKIFGSLVKFRFSPVQLFQMEHLEKLLPDISGHDMVMFCDDDDTYHPERVQGFVDGFHYGFTSAKETGKFFGGVRETKETNYPEYWCYGVVPSIIHTFYERMKDNRDLLRNKFADMYLRLYLQRTMGLELIFTALIRETPLYYYNTNNPESICATIQKEGTSTDLHDQLVLATICENKKDFKNQVQFASLTKKRIAVLFPEKQRIERLLEKLYE